jgi:diguanylate cyclase (GGDEF)-like protein
VLAGSWARLAPLLRPSQWRKPAIATHRVLATTTGLLYVCGALLVMATLCLPDRGAADVAPMWGLVAIALAIGATTLAVGRRFPHGMYHVLVGAGTVIITLLVLLAGGGSLSLAYGSLYVFVAIDCFFFFAWPAAMLHLVAFEVLSALASRHVGLGFSGILLQQGCAAVVALVVGWLARAAAQAERDPLTSLLNRRGFDRAFADALDAAHHSQTVLSLVLFDVDFFKQVNDTLGHLGGDRLLQQGSQAWSALLRADQKLARYGGDEFALILPGCPSDRAGAIADQLRAALQPQGVTCSAGVAERQPGDSASMLFSRADVALYEAKSNGRAQTSIYGRPGRRGAEELEQAVRAGQLEMYYQPIVDLATSREIGAEALVRWNHPDRGLVMPNDFIPQAEQSGAIHAVGRWTLMAACRHAAREQRRTGALWHVSVNVAGAELRRPDYPVLVAETMEQTGLTSAALTLEVTETTFDTETDVVATCLQQVRRLGVRVAIDDFGTGHSTLSRLDRIPADALKIDRSFVQALPADGGPAPVLEAIVALARALHLTTVAEGIETARQATTLRALGCSHGQGYLFGRPGPARTGSVVTQRTSAAAVTRT